MAESARLPSSSFSELKKIVQGYAHLGENVQLDELARLLGIAKTTISPNNPALTEIGLIEGGKTKRATPLGLNLGRALEHDHREDVRKCLQEVVRRSEFLSKVISTVRIKREISVDDLSAHILYASGLKMSKANKTGARTYTDLLLESGLLTETNGLVVVASLEQTEPRADLGSPADSTQAVPTAGARAQAQGTEQRDVKHEAVRQVGLSKSPTSIAINIQLQIPATENPRVYENLFKALREHLLQPSEGDHVE